MTAVRSEEKAGDDGNKFTVYYFKDSGMQFDPNGNEIVGLVKHVSFQTGDLAGRDFEANYDSKTGNGKSSTPILMTRRKYRVAV